VVDAPAPAPAVRDAPPLLKVGLTPVPAEAVSLLTGAPPLLKVGLAPVV